MNIKEEDWEILGRSIGTQLRDLSKRQHTIATKLISDVIYHATLNNLSEDSFVSVSSNNQAASSFLYSSFTPSRSSCAHSEYHPPVHTSSSPQDSRLPTLQAFQHQTQSPHPSTSKKYIIQSPDSPLPTLQAFQHKTQSPHPSTSKRYPVKYIVQAPHPFNPSPQQCIELHISSPPLQSSTPRINMKPTTVCRLLKAKVI